MKTVTFFLLCVLLVLPAFAQSDRGTITGTVTDASGARIPGVAVVITNTGTGTKSQTVTTETGNYTIPALPVGTYAL